MSAVIDTPDHHAGDHHHGPAKGLMRWVLTTNHKDIGTLYLWFSFMMFLLGGSMAMVIRAELFQPGLQIVEPAFFNQMTTMHGLIMVFGAVMPAFVGLANWMIPLMIGAPDTGPAADEQLQLLAAAGGLRPAGQHPVHARRRPQLRLDLLCAAVDHLRPAQRDASSSSPSTWPGSARSWARST